MSFSIIIIDDDQHTLNTLKDEIQHIDKERGIYKVNTFRKISKAKIYFENEENVSTIKCCILDLMFPPEDDRRVYGDLRDLADGIAFYEKYLRNKIRTIVLTAALNWPEVAKAVRSKIIEGPNTIIVDKPFNLRYLIDLIKNWIEQ
jgi:DNA-binding NtrC family response regulator